MTNKLITEASRCANCVADKSRFLKQKSNKKSNKKVVGTKLILNFSYIKHKPLQNMFTYCLKCKKPTKNADPKELKNSKTVLSSKFAVCCSKKVKIFERTRNKRIIK